MPTTAAVLYIRPTGTAVIAAARRTAATLYVPLRTLTGLFSTAGVTKSKDTHNLKAWFPSQRVPLAGQELMQPEWYRFFQYLTETVLGGANGSTLPDVAASVTYAEAQSIATAAVTKALAQQGAANAQSLSAVVQVAVASALPGSAQIPPVQLYPVDTPIGEGGSAP